MLNNKKIVWIIAALIVMPAIYSLIRDPFGLFRHIQSIIQGVIPDDEFMPLWSTILGFLFYLIVFLRLIAGYGVFKLKTWGKNLALGTLGAHLIIFIFGLINRLTYYDRYPENCEMAKELLKNIESGQSQGVVETVSIIPSYIIAAVSLISIILLLKIDFKKFIELK